MFVELFYNRVYPVRFRMGTPVSSQKVLKNRFSMPSREGGNNTGLHLLEAGIVIISRCLDGRLSVRTDEAAFHIVGLDRD